MTIVDVNLLLYAYNSSSEHHPRARTWLQEVLSRPQPVGLPLVVILAFLRIATNSRAFVKPYSIGEAMAIVASWLGQPQVRLLEPGDLHWTILTRLLEEAQVRGPLVMDAHLAALAIEHGATLCTTDRDFRRFPELRILNPLA